VSSSHNFFVIYSTAMSFSNSCFDGFVLIFVFRRFHEYQLGKPILDYKITDPIEAAQFDKLAGLLNRLDIGILKVDETLILLEKF
jgi:hypothetical protein